MFVLQVSEPIIAPPEFERRFFLIRQAYLLATAGGGTTLRCGSTILLNIAIRSLWRMVSSFFFLFFFLLNPSHETYSPPCFLLFTLIVPVLYLPYVLLLLSIDRVTNA